MVLARRENVHMASLTYKWSGGRGGKEGGGKRLKWNHGTARASIWALIAILTGVLLSNKYFDPVKQRFSYSKLPGTEFNKIFEISVFFFFFFFFLAYLPSPNLGLTPPGTYIKWPDVPFWPGQYRFWTCCPGVPKYLVGTPFCPVLLKN